MSSSMPIDKAYAHCQSIANDHYENFPTASLLLKKELRPAVAVIYAFARAADDFADEGDFTVDERLTMLDDWEHQLDLCLQGKSENPVFIALADVMRKFDLNVQLFRDLLTAFRMDVKFKGFKTLDELMFYGKHSADPVGRLMLALHNIDDVKALQASDAICTALQLTNFWQDFKLDIAKGRCYLADAWLSKVDVSRDDVLQGSVAIETLRPAIDEAIAETQKLFNQGYALLPYLPFRLRLQIAATLAGGTSILHTTQALNNPLEERPILNKLAWLKISLSIVSMALRPNVYAKRGKV